MSDNTGGSDGPGDPPMDSYSRTEIDAKLEVLELRIDNKLDRINIELSWVKWVSCATFLLILGGMIKLLLFP